jgi:hypothetical protein
MNFLSAFFAVEVAFYQSGCKIQASAPLQAASPFQDVSLPFARCGIKRSARPPQV